MTLFALAMISFVTERRGETRGSCRCLGTGPRNYGYDRIIIYGFAHEGVAVERKGNEHLRERIEIGVIIDQIVKLCSPLSPVSRNVPLPRVAEN